MGNLNIYGLNTLALLLAILPMPYCYYQVLRWLVLVSVVLIVMNKHLDKNTKITFIVLGIIFNPIVPFYFGAAIWKLIDFFTAIWFGYQWLKEKDRR